jgi:hypothetical protein
MKVSILTSLGVALLYRPSAHPGWRSLRGSASTAVWVKPNSASQSLSSVLKVSCHPVHRAAEAHCWSVLCFTRWILLLASYIYVVVSNEKQVIKNLLVIKSWFMRRNMRRTGHFRSNIKTILSIGILWRQKAFTLEDRSGQVTLGHSKRQLSSRWQPKSHRHESRRRLYWRLTQDFCGNTV